MARHKFQELIDRMSPERREEYLRNVKKGLAQIRLEDMRLNEIRRALKLSQQTLARRLKTDQAQISRMEQRTDLFVSTVRRYVEALGGQLEIVATFPEATVRIENFSELRSVPSGAGKRPGRRRTSRKRAVGVA